MIIKERSIPYRLLILEAILRRLPLSHNKYQQILEEHNRRLAGYEGEKSLDYYFRLLDEQKYWILHDLNLPDGDFNCQIDTLLLTSKFGIVIDSKNMGGKLIFDTDNQQFTQFYNDKEKGYPDPISQAERHIEYIKKLLASYNFPPLPIDYMVVLSNSYCTYLITGKNAHKVRPRVCKSDAFLNKIQIFDKLYTDACLTSEDLNKICHLLVKMNTLPTNYLLKKNGLQKSDFKLGCQCPDCKHFSLIRKKQNWECTNCKRYFKDAHIQALKDYFLLFDTKMTNKQFREFVKLDSIHTAGRLLRSAGLQCSGAKKDRYYQPDKIPW